MFGVQSIAGLKSLVDRRKARSPPVAERLSAEYLHANSVIE